MGVVNVTPDSFSDGGKFLALDDAVAHGVQLAEMGAAVLDIGGESTRPGAEPVDADEELRRVIPVVRELAGSVDALVSIDTQKASVAAAALDAGARIVNDVSGGTADTEMARVVADADAGFVVMHMRGTPATMQDETGYDNLLDDVCAELRRRLDTACAAGVDARAMLADPGIGFAKTADQNVALLRALPDITARVGVPVLVGASRKSFLGALLGSTTTPDRDDATLAMSVWCFEHGAAVVRVHDVAASCRAAELLMVMEEAAA
jgi:dihydropteroate synthase